MSKGVFWKTNVCFKSSVSCIGATLTKWPVLSKVEKQNVEFVNLNYNVVYVGEDSYQSLFKMNWRDPEFDQHEPKPWAQAEKCEYSIDKTNTDI